MCKNSTMTRIYFSHDQDSRTDDKILQMFFDFRKTAKTLSREELESLAGISCYAIFWSIIEYMYRNSFLDKDVELLADELRINPKFVKKVLEDFNLFLCENGEYISKRVKRNLEQQKEKSMKAKKAADVRWLISFYDTAYKNEFGITPVLDDEEIKNLQKYSETIDDFNQILPDILYTLNSIQFDGKTKFEPKSNWLLKSNNLAKVYHGEFGALKHKKTAAEIKAEEKAKQELEAEKTANQNEFAAKIQSIAAREEAVDFIIQNTVKTRAGTFINPNMNNLMKKFDISAKEIEGKFNEKNTS